MKVNDEMQSLNEGLWTDFSVEELESRLETDPMLMGNPLDASVEFTEGGECFTCTMGFTCGEFLS